MKQYLTQHKKTIIFIFFAVLLSAVCFFFFRGSSEEDIVKGRIVRSLKRQEKTEPESDLIALATAKGVSDYCMNTVSGSWNGHEQELLKQQTIPLISSFRREYDKLQFRIRNLKIECSPDHTEAKASFSLAAEGILTSGESVCDIFAVHTVLQKNKDGKYVYQTAEIRYADPD